MYQINTKFRHSLKKFSKNIEKQTKKEKKVIISHFIQILFVACHLFICTHNNSDT